VATRTPATALRVGTEWITHRDFAAVEGLDAHDCDGTLLLADVSRPNLVEASCDGCSFVGGVGPEDVRAVLHDEPRELFWWQR
jgi:hypothetical protein